MALDGEIGRLNFSTSLLEGGFASELRAEAASQYLVQDAFRS